jgi:hypothetical protein
MKELTIIIWLILFPLATTLDNFISEKTRKIRKEEKRRDINLQNQALIEVIVFVSVLIYLIKF